VRPHDQSGSTAITLLVPGLLGPWPRELHADVVAGLDLDSLEALLGRTSAPLAASGRAPCSVEGLLLAALCPEGAQGGRKRFDDTAPCSEDWPYAAITYAADTGKLAEGWILRCDPVHLRPDVGTAYLFAGDELDLSAEEAQVLAATLNAHWSDEGLTLEVPCADRWYLRVHQAPELEASPPSVVGRREIGTFLPKDKGQLTWRGRFNEAQMVLHQASVNAARERRGALAVNSVWFWGAGKLPETPPGGPRQFDRIWSDLPIARGLQALGWQDVSALPPDAKPWLENLCPGRHLVIVDDAHGAAISNDVEAWREALYAIEQRWLQPLLQTKRRIGVSFSAGLTPGCGSLHVRRPRFMDRWRRPRTLAGLLTEADRS